ncbi:imidazole glycerol phosphate synthase subunit HisH [Paenibacillus lutimineralis]|uniref:Imidazole glycerol phosphate synthase subunit HisH n=1 Tax=Paenibacillus lutimineralis TaxID=2707005 RepID=A0A3S9USC2_9BACL|nr:imidazole glycerol phosphate synthase subunit HisH [Paenibacillus lutimineralis]AZS13171.1 imidazole glycerol phosphate synthase subunit HisH [Paenibacillus lutimineralis]
MKLAIVDYGMGNLHSVAKAIERLGYEAVVSGDAAVLLAADGILLPGVGAFGDAMEQLTASGLDGTLRQAVDSGKPLLGICLGMQLLFSASGEHGLHDGLGLLPGRAVRFSPESGLKVPHMGWNRLQFKQPEHPLLAGLDEGHVYFVHSYHVLPEREQDLLAVTDYGQPVTAIVGRGNVFGMQFHPEKSGELGMALLRNFLALVASGAAIS